MENSYCSKKYKILDVTSETKIDYTYKIQFEGAVNHGQFLQVSIPTVGECPISISNFGEGFIELTIRHIGTVTNEIKKLEAGDYINLRGPYGNGFFMDNYKGKQLVIAAGGTGLAPVRSTIKYFNTNFNDIKKLDLLMGFKTPGDILFKDEVESWLKSENMNVILTVDRIPEENNEQLIKCNTGFITSYVPNIEISDFDNIEVIIVGPPIMMSNTAREFLKLGIREENIWVSFERNMSCGLGKCGHCKIDETYVCLEGPVFNFSQAKKLMD